MSEGKASSVVVDFCGQCALIGDECMLPFNLLITFMGIHATINLVVLNNSGPILLT